MAASGFGHLGLDERRSVFRLRKARVPVAEIASRLGVSSGYVQNVVTRNRLAREFDWINVLMKRREPADSFVP